MNELPEGPPLTVFNLLMFVMNEWQIIETEYVVENGQDILSFQNVMFEHKKPFLYSGLVLPVKVETF